jgi:hypothetical protein
MEFLQKVINKLLIFSKEPQKIGLSQFKEVKRNNENKAPSVKNKNVKLSDLMRRAG